MASKSDTVVRPPLKKKSGAIQAAKELAGNIKASYAKPQVSEAEALRIAERHYAELGWSPSGLAYERCTFQGKHAYRFQEAIKGHAPSLYISATDGGIIYSELKPFESA